MWRLRLRLRLRLERACEGGVWREAPEGTGSAHRRDRPRLCFLLRCYR